MPISATPRPSGSSGNAPAVTNGKALAVVTTIFFMWGFLTCLNDILIPHLKAVFELNYAKAMLVQFTFFGTYFLMSLPAGRLVAALGYKKGIVAGLVIAGIGALGFWPATNCACTAPSSVRCSYWPRALPCCRSPPTRTSRCWARNRPVPAA